jgi:fructokinase
MKPIVSFGEALIDMLGKTPTEFVANPGGAPANVAAAAAKLGAEAFFVGKVGRDAFGDAIRAKLNEAGVRTDFLLATDAGNTALAFVTLNSDGERRFSFYRERTADLLIAADDIPLALLKQAFCFHFGSLTLTAEPARSATLHAVRKARECGCLISYDPNLRLNLWPNAELARERIMELLPLADIIKINEEELRFLSSGALPSEPEKSDPETLAAALFERYPAQCWLVTLGAAGCLTVTGQGVARFPGRNVRAIDTTGAGDAFVGAFLARAAARAGSREAFGELVRNEAEWRRMIEFAVAASALSTTAHGAIDSYPDAEQVNRFLQQTSL